jgi:polyisoprenoid-binding protein YceI
MLRSVSIISALLAGLPASAPAQRPVPAVQEFALDAGHTIIEFSVGFAVSHVKGRFTQPRGTILYDAAHPESSSVTIIIDAKSIDTGWQHRDEHLRTSDFFDVGRFPVITFQSDRLRRNGQGWIMEGPLTMHGVTRRVAIPFTFLEAPGRNAASGGLTLSAAGAIRLSRKDYGILGGSTYNSWFTQLRNSTVADTVEISLELEGWLHDAQSQRTPAIDGVVQRMRAEGVNTYIARMREAKAARGAKEFDGLFHGADLVVRALLMDGRGDDAVMLSRAMTELFPAQASAYLVHGYALSLAGDKAGALRAMTEAKRLHPQQQDDGSWYDDDQLARSAIELGKTAEAIQLAKTLTEMYPVTARAHVTYGVALAAAGDVAGARAALARALSLDGSETRAIEWNRRLTR